MVFSLSLLKAMSSSCIEQGEASCASCSVEYRRMRVGTVLVLGWFFHLLCQSEGGMLC